MDLTIYPSQLQGDVCAIPSKSQAHRLLICAAFADSPTFLNCPQTNEDIEATARCLNALGANIERSDRGYCVIPVRDVKTKVLLDCGESGSTLRFLLPVVCALGVSATIKMHGRLPERPLSPLWEELERMGCTLTRPARDVIETAGKLHAGTFYINGNVSSQFVTGLLLAAPLLNGETTIKIMGKLESAPYVEMTKQALRMFGVSIDGLAVPGSSVLHSPGNITVEGDWSNAAFFLGAKALGNVVSVTNLNWDSAQGDRAIAEIFANTDTTPTISAADIPDLVPILAVVFGCRKGVKFTDIGRLRLKESDRVASVCKMLTNLGARADATETTLSVKPGKYHSCSIDTAGDHRIAMATAIAATVADGPVTIRGTECVSKSYPAFWQEYERLGGKYEQYIR